MWQLPASFGTPPRSFGSDNLDLDFNRKRHCQDTFRSLTGTYFLGSLNRRPPCYFAINNVLIHSPTGRIQPEQRVLVSTNEQCLLLSAHPRHRLMGCVNLPMDDRASSATKH